MGRGRSDRIEEIKSYLVLQVSQGKIKPGARFPSNRALMTRYQISYQTADRLIREMCEEGWVERRPASGTYVLDRPKCQLGAHLIFGTKAKNAACFGATVHQRVKLALEECGIPVRMTWSESADTSCPDIVPGWFPVIWDAPSAVSTCIHKDRSALTIQDGGPRNFQSQRIDSVTIDEYGGGVRVGQMVKAAGYNAKDVVVLTSGTDELQQRARIDGFLTEIGARVFLARSEQLPQAIKAVSQAGSKVVFCVHDRSADKLVPPRLSDIDRPLIVGFSDHEDKRFSGIASVELPWKEMVDTCVDLVRRRLINPDGGPRHHMFVPQPLGSLSLY